MNTVTPESIGIASENIDKYIKTLDKKRVATHSVIMAKGDDIFFERYWAPFDKDFKHRMYSVSKSIVALAVGFLIQDGKLGLDDTMEQHFEKELKNQPDEHMHRQTVRNMLMMQTVKPNRRWFEKKPNDRVNFYFENDLPASRPAGTVFNYDSEGSFVLGALVERITGMNFMDYLHEKLFKKIGVSSDAYALKCPGGHSWGDSGVMFTSRDLLKTARFVLNGGRWNGEQLLNEDYINMMTAHTVFNNYTDTNSPITGGYGYQVWGSYDKAFVFYGMGCQYAYCIPEKDMILIYTADNQGKESMVPYILDGFYDNIAYGEPLKKQPSDSLFINNPENFKLIAAVGNKHSEFEKEINGAAYALNENPMGITKIKFTFTENGGTFEYTNAQGDKKIPFGLLENAFVKFPQEGYSDEVGSVETKDFYYDCAASAAWVEPQKLLLKVQIIDRYFGNFTATFGFKDDECGIYMEKYAEAFLNEYCGFAGGKRV